VIKKIVVANRGEIACRIIRSVQKMGLKAVALYSEADVGAPHALAADEAVLIGPALVAHSYLDQDRVIQAAHDMGADAIHPGYGFLSENATFAKRVRDEGLTFIGPTPEAIETMGDKLAAKAAVAGYDVPMLGGTDKSIESLEVAREVGDQIGYPLLIKAAAGGGGKGMRIVRDATELEEQLQRAKSEAKASFGNDMVFIEKYLEAPRHIEMQILADNHGNVIHVFERECSIQRRHQKVMEEAPASGMTPELRTAMGEAAVQVARSCAYQGAGTVEFLLDHDNTFFFLEMNTRLQVEHPVTEMIAGLDLVEEQIRIARGERLRWQQEDLNIKGHAIELRVYAEDPENDFLPSIGSLDRFRFALGEGIRLDSGYREGMLVPLEYDPLLAKLIAHGPDRMTAVRRLRSAIASAEIAGVRSTLSFGDFVCRHPAFVQGAYDTHFVSSHFSGEDLVPPDLQKSVAKAALFLYLKELERFRIPSTDSSNE